MNDNVRVFGIPAKFLHFWKIVNRNDVKPDVVFVAPECMFDAINTNKQRNPPDFMGFMTLDTDIPFKLKRDIFDFLLVMIKTDISGILDTYETR